MRLNLKFKKNNKAIGRNSISTAVLRNFRKALSIPLTELINLSFTQGKFPANLKTAKIPVFKKGDKLNTNNCRRISLISNKSQNN